MEIVLLLRDEIVYDILPAKRHHILMQFDSVSINLPPVIVGLPVVIHKDRRVNASAGQLHRAVKGPLRPVGHGDALPVVVHTEIEIIFPVLFDAIRRVEQMQLSSLRIQILLLLRFLLFYQVRMGLRFLPHHFLNERRRVLPVNSRISRRSRIPCP